jgi:hypothetical protein
MVNRCAALVKERPGDSIRDIIAQKDIPFPEGKGIRDETIPRAARRITPVIPKGTERSVPFGIIYFPGG